ncbi:MAG: hypothetical protein EPN46_05145 [Candidimonas sp.]|nr:MAG: hypothetical protein EPN77_04155 [Candidimonas sp.]TAM24629.1 MAG: hypothetical protein EPN62_06200 [Candidimonas sp.]TAM78014.1 MAG: hypothetical protein EPN46_05145 [Candidimonas sp.]
MSRAVIRLEDVNKWYGQFHVLRHINLAVSQGEIIEQNTPDRFFDAPENERTRLFLSQVLH